MLIGLLTSMNIMTKLIWEEVKVEINEAKVEDTRVEVVSKRETNITELFRYNKFSPDNNY